MLHALTIALALAFAPPLSDEQQRDLQTAIDGGEYTEQAFYALVQSVRAWPSSSPDDDEAIRLTPDWQGMLERPGEYRGDLCRMSGELLQQTTLAAPYEDVSEWFVRDQRTTQPVIVYVVHAEGKPAFTIHDRVQIDARFYKRMEFRARDKQTRDYPALVGRFPESVAHVAPAPPAGPGPASMPGAAGRTADRLWLLAGVIFMLLLGLVVLRVWIARGRRGRVRATQSQQHLRTRWRQTEGAMDRAMDDAAGLPDDPAEALTELRRRAKDDLLSEHARDQGQSAASQ